MMMLRLASHASSCRGPPRPHCPAAAAAPAQPLGAPTPPTVPPSPSPPQPFSGDEAGTNADDAACCICLDALHRAARAAPPAHPQVRATCTATAGLMPQVAAPAPCAACWAAPSRQAAPPPSEEAAEEAAGSSTARHTPHPQPHSRLTAAPSPRRGPATPAAHVRRPGLSPGADPTQGRG